MVDGYLSEKWKVKSSAPCRIHVGGALDLKSIAYHLDNSTTVTIALNMRTIVEITPFQKGLIKITENNIYEISSLTNLPLEGPFGLLWAIISIYGLDGLELNIFHNFPSKSGLGGSSILTVCAIACLDYIKNFLNNKSPLTKSEICISAHEIEDGLRYSITGMQDQCAAVFGKVYKWSWKYNTNAKFNMLYLPVKNQIEDKLLVAYIGQESSSIDVCDKLISTFKDQKTRNIWRDLVKVTNNFSEALINNQWDKVIDEAENQMEIYYILLPELVDSIALNLWSLAKECNASFNKLGIGNGGCCWSLCNTVADTEKLGVLWEKALSNIPTAKLLSSCIDDNGLIVEGFS